MQAFNQSNYRTVVSKQLLFGNPAF